MLTQEQKDKILICIDRALTEYGLMKENRDDLLFKYVCPELQNI